MSDRVDEDHKARDAHSYDDVADEFDRLTDKVSVSAAEALVAAIPQMRNENILDIGCGTGVVTLAAAQRLGATSHITGVDLSPGMLAVAERKAAQRGLGDKVTFVQGDAEAQTFADGSMDAVVSLYAWRHFPNPEKATAEVFRILRSGGTFAVAVGSRPSLASAKGIEQAFATIFRKIAQARGRELVANDHIDSLMHLLPAQAEDETPDWQKHKHGFGGSLDALLKDAGFQIQRSDWIGRTFTFDSAEEFWTLQSTFSSIARKRIADAAPADVAKLRAEFDRQCNAVLKAGGKLAYRVGAAMVVAKKP